MSSLLLALLLGQATATTQIRLAVGETRTLPSSGAPLQLVCDDLAVVQPKITAEGLQLTGAHEGKTVCSLLNTRYAKSIYQVTVTAK